MTTSSTQRHTNETPQACLRDSSPAAAGLDAKPINDALAQIAGWEELSGSTHPLYAGAVTLLGHDEAVVAREASGYAMRYAAGAGTELPRDQWVPMHDDTIFDMASVTKLFTSILVMQQIERGAIRLKEPVATYLPAFAAHGKSGITARQLLTHTSGLKAWMPLWRDWPDKASRIAAVLDVEPTSPPGTRMTDTGYNPDPSLKPRVAATEFEANPSRGMVWGEVHDENAWSLGGIAGHAGIFSTAQDMAVLAQSLINDNHAFPHDSHGLGFELDQRWYMSGLSSPTTGRGAGDRRGPPSSRVGNNCVGTTPPTRSMPGEGSTSTPCASLARGLRAGRRATPGGICRPRLDGGKPMTS